MNLPSQELRRVDWPFVALVTAYFHDSSLTALGTGTLIHPRLILTAGHVLFDKDLGRPDQVEVRLGGYVPEGRTAEWYESTREWQDRDSRGSEPAPTSDFGVIRLGVDQPIPPDVARAAVPVVTDDLEVDHLTLCVVGFPAEDGRLGNLYGASNRAYPGEVARNGTHFQYEVDTYEGMSGGPVYSLDASNRVLVRGVHTMMFEGVGTALRITNTVADVIREWYRGVGVAV
jgi:V8-like Glu-specific endopeptidase